MARGRVTFGPTGWSRRSGSLAGMTLLVLHDLAWMAAIGGSVVAVMLGLRATQRRPD